MKKKFNKKLLAVGAMVLGLATITGTALATYVITGGTKEGSTDAINPTDVSVVNKVVNLEVGLPDSTLLFQPLTAVNSGRLQTEEDGDLTVTVKLSVTASNVDYINDVAIAYSATGTAVDDGYVTYPTKTNVTKTEFKLNEGTKKYEVDLNLDFGWGTKFGGNDPCTYFNENGAGSNIPLTTGEETVPGQSVESIMNAFTDSINGTAFTITFTMA